MSSSERRYLPIAEGQPIRTIDRKYVGRVKIVEPAHLRVDVRFRPDFWLSRDVVAFANPRGVTLSIHASELASYRLKSPWARLALIPSEPRP
jgi:hypothetical protein